MDNLKKLCDNVLQKARDHYGKVVSVSTGSSELCEDDINEVTARQSLCGFKSLELLTLI